MLAASYEFTGPAREVLRLGEWPDPVPGAGEVRVRLHWSGINPSDVKTRAGLRSKQLPFPYIVPHSDGMGVIDSVGPGVSADRVGQRVWVWNAAWGRAHGTAAQYVVLPDRQAVRLPDSAPDEAGACLGIPALTALHGVLTHGGVEGQSVLVAGGAGAVGHYAVQFARLLGARQVIATVSSPEKGAIACQAGADLAIQYRQPDAAGQILDATGGKGVDRVIEVDIAANGALDLEILVPGGLCAVYGSGTGQFSLPFFPCIARNIAMQFFIVYNLPEADRRRAQDTLTNLMERGALTHRIAARLPLQEVVQGHEMVESGAAIGNVVLSIP